MELTDKTPVRLTQVSLFFSVANFIINGLGFSSIGLFLIFTLSVFSTTKIFVTVNQLQHSTNADMSGLMLQLFITALLFIGIATFAYSCLFGIFYLFVAAVYLISPYDRDWLSGKSELVLSSNKIEYREV